MLDKMDYIFKKGESDAYGNCFYVSATTLIGQRAQIRFKEDCEVGAET